ncbi:Ig-like domain-containing protein [Pseudoduganella violacea]|uniref:Big-1 domain-containing protein n=1 Tax=Pseudoduganella violacea TaxID=1715466 RepID=A0A7W5BDW5_9BURK|nr:hypothetical protein [Pseudoduganella violacea]MBB3121352.1 hypothetical protein [Pseudoduganella violacea]
MSVILSACGGGGGGSTTSAGCVTIDPSRDPALPSCGGSTSAPATASAAGSAALSMSDSSGATSSVSPDRSGTVQAQIKDSKGLVVPNVAVTFTSTDKTAVLSPASGTALTDSSGIARIGIGAGSQAGGYTINATANVGSGTVSSSLGYSVSFPALALSDLRISPATLSAGGNASVGVTVMNGANVYLLPVAVSFSSACISAGKAVMGTPVTTQSGIATASYTDKGCGTADVITASVTTPGGTASKAGTINVLPASAGSFKFISVSNSNLALKGTGGPGRPEFSTVKFQIFDASGSPLAGKQVNFAFSDSTTSTTVGGLSLNTASALTGADGTVTTDVAAGTIPTSVRVVATVSGTSPPLTSVSSILVVSSGVPDQAHFSLSTAIGNCEGRDIDQLCSTVKVISGDHFGNPVPDGTAINFSAEGGNIGASCLTKDGMCSVPLYSSAPRQANERITVLAYALGEENLIDNNGNNTYDAGDSFTDKRPDIFRDDNESGSWNTGEACVGPNLAGTCSTAGDGQYNGVLRSPQVPSAQTLYVSAQLVQIFAGSTASIGFSTSSLSCSAGGTADVVVTVADPAGTIMPAGSIIDMSALFGVTASTVAPSQIKVPNVVAAVGQAVPAPSYAVTVGCPTPAGKGKLIVKVTSPSGVISSASLPIN